MKPSKTIVLLSAAFLMIACGGGSSGRDDAGLGAGRWQPIVSDTWQWQLTGTINTGYDVDVYDIDLFETATSAIEQLKNEGRRILCYFSAGSYEDWRPDQGDFDAADLGEPLDGWPGERWLDIRSAGVRQIMQARLDLAVRKGCDGVEPDNVDGYANHTGFTLTADDQLDYNRFLAREAHRRNLAIALKNDEDQVDTLVDYFDLAVNEQCHQYNECGTLTPFIHAGKPVFNAEYDSDYVNNPVTRQNLCTTALGLNFHTLVLPPDLDDRFRYSCDPP